MAFCPKQGCERIPKIEFESLNQIHISCECKYDNKLSLHSYLNALNIKEVSSNLILIDDNDNEIKEIQSKLAKSKQYLTETLNNIRIRVINSANELVEEKIRQINEEKNRLLNTLKTELDDLQTSYKNCLERNNEIISLLEKLLSYYNIAKSHRTIKEHQTIKENLIKNSNFIQSNCSESNSLKELIWSFDNYSIISTSANELNEIKTIKTKSKITNLLLLKDKRLAVCFNKELKIYNIDNDYRCDATIEGEFKTICQLDDGNIATYYRKIEIWDIRTYQRIFSTYCDNLGDNGNMVTISNNRIALSTGTQQIKENFGVENPPYIIKIYTPYHDIPNEVIQVKNKINSMLYMKNKNWLVLFLQKEIEIFEMSKYSNVNTINRLYIENSEMKDVHYLLDENRIIIGGTHCSILNVNNKGIEPMNVDNINYYSSFIKLKFNKILFGFHNGELRMIDLTNKNMKIMKTQQNEDIENILKINNTMFCTTSANGTISFLNYYLLD